MTTDYKATAEKYMEYTTTLGKTDTRLLEMYIHTAEVYALLAIAEAIEKLGK